MSRNPRRFWPKWGIGIKINWCVATRVYAYFSRLYCEQPINQQGINCSGLHFDDHNRASMHGHHNLSISLTRASWRANLSNEKLPVESSPSYRLGWHRDSYPNTSFVLLGLPHSLAFSVDVEKLRRRSINFFSSVRISERSTSSPSIEHCEGLSQIVSHSLLVLRETVWFDRSSRYVMVSPVVCGYPP